VSTAAKPQTLTTADFHAAVHTLAPTVAVFDCDGTLWSGDAGIGFMRWTVDGGLLSREAIDWLDDRYRAYLRGEVTELAICGEMVQIYHGLRESEMRAAAAEFFATRIEKNIFPEMLTLVRQLQARGTEIWAVSSTCNWVIEEGMSRFDIPSERILAARVVAAEGLVTPTLIDVPTDEAKVASLARVGITRPDAAFGNSIHDAAMLAIALRAFPIDPTPALLAHSVHERWPIFYPASVAPA
jgi:phosphoserine phosphatase